MVIFGFFVLVFFGGGCGKKGDPIPLYKEPLFSNNIEEGSTPDVINPDSEKKGLTEIK
jgi:hypothetical protein